RFPHIVLRRGAVANSLERNIHPASLLAGVTGSLIFASIAVTETLAQGTDRPSGQTADEVPGAVGEVAGHVPDQLQQASEAPVLTSANGSPSARQWWDPGDGHQLPAFQEYANELG